jgi:hypothetical protein
MRCSDIGDANCWPVRSVKDGTGGNQFIASNTPKKLRSAIKTAKKKKEKIFTDVTASTFVRHEQMFLGHVLLIRPKHASNLFSSNSQNTLFSF